MKRALPTIALLIAMVFCFAQSDTSTTKFIANELPHYKGGDSALYNFIRETIEYPQLCVDSQIQGKVYIGFTVTAEGKAKDAHVIKGVCPLLNDEAVRVVNQMTEFVPGKTNGKEVDVYQSVPVSFKLAEYRAHSSYYKVISNCDVWPEYEGGDDSLEDYLFFKMPVYRYHDDFEGESVLAGFIVDTLGDITNIRILNDQSNLVPADDSAYMLSSAYGDLPEIVDSAAVKVLKGLKKFKPATLNGRKVNVYVVMQWSVIRKLTNLSTSYPLPTPPVVLGDDAFIFRQLNRKVKPDSSLADMHYTTIELNFIIDTLGRIQVEEPLPENTKYHPRVYAHAVSALRSITRKFTPAKDENGKVVNAFYSIAQNFSHTGRKYKFDDTYFILPEASRYMIYYSPEKEAKFPGGDEALKTYIRQSLRYPALEKAEGIVGRTWVRVVVDEDGVVSDPKLYVSMTKGINDESLRLVGSLPKFIPAEHHGKKVKSYYFVHVSFRL